MALRRLSERPGAEAAAAEEGDEEALLAAAAERKAAAAAKRKDAVEARKALFVHVRLNRVHCRVTYQVRSAALCLPLSKAFLRMLSHIPLTIAWPWMCDQGLLKCLHQELLPLAALGILSCHLPAMYMVTWC